MKHYTWKNINPEQEEKIKNYLITLGAIPRDTSKNPYLKWSLKLSDAVFDFFTSKKGTKLYCNGSKSNDPQIREAYEFIDKTLGRNFSEYDFYIGADETGKGEIIGNIILVATLVPKELLNTIDKTIANANTKNKKDITFWAELMYEIQKLQEKGLYYLAEEIPANSLTKNSTNILMDKAYVKLLTELLKKIPTNKSIRITIDNYKIGTELRNFLQKIKNENTTIQVLTKADDNFIEVRLASIIAKWLREKFIFEINNNPKYTIEGLKIGYGSVANPNTIKWLKAWMKSGRELPPFVKTYFKTISEIRKGITKSNLWEEG